MKIGRSTDSLTVAASLDDLSQMARLMSIRNLSEIAATCRISANGEFVSLLFNSTGRRFHPTRGGNSWNIQFNADACGARAIEKFGMSPTMWTYIGGRRIDVMIPDLRMPMKQMKPVIQKPRAFVPPTRVAPGLRPEKPKQELFLVEGHDPTDEQLLEAKRVFNHAIERGFKPQFDGRGRVMFFDRRVGE